MANDLWCQVLVVGPNSVTLAAHRIEGTGTPNLSTVDDVARLALLAGRLGGHIVLSEVAPALSALLELSGLSGLCGQMERQSEGRKESLGIDEVQEELHPGDLPP
jgi:hypothetical protein